MILHFFIEKIIFHISKLFFFAWFFQYFFVFFLFLVSLNFHSFYIYVVNKHFGNSHARSVFTADAPQHLPAEQSGSLYVSGIWQTAIQEQAFKTVLFKVEWPCCSCILLLLTNVSGCP